MKTETSEYGERLPMRKLLFWICAGLVLPVCANATTVTFTEINIGSLNALTNEYAAYGVTFQNTFYVQDERCPGGDDFCISGSDYPATVTFTSAVGQVSFQWGTIRGDITVNAYDASNNLLGTYTNVGGDEVSGTGTITAPGIKYITFSGSGGVDYLTLDTLSFGGSTTVPALSEWALAVLAVLLSGLAAWKLRLYPSRA
jgi:hypothetical protein